MGEYLSAGLDALAEEFVHVGPPHGLGLMQAIDIRRGKQGSVDHDRRDRIVNAAFYEGLLLLGCGEGGIRFIPSLTVEKGHIDAMLNVLRKVLKTA
jgi:4-aminobutyrate aminotransferase